MSEDISEISKERVREWFSREGIKVESITNPRAVFVFKVKYMRFFFTVVRPNDQNYIQVESQVMISQEHMQKLTAAKMREFQMKAMQHSFTQEFSMGFIQPRPGQPGPKPPGPGFAVSDRIYDDAFSDDMLWRTMRRLHSAVDMSIALLNEVSGQVSKGPEPSTDTGPSYYT
ncbi:MAG: DUF2299 family protein [Candidatus Thorarchaeota archaeon]